MPSCFSCKRLQRTVLECCQNLLLMHLSFNFNKIGSFQICHHLHPKRGPPTGLGLHHIPLPLVLSRACVRYNRMGRNIYCYQFVACRSTMYLLFFCLFFLLIIQSHRANKLSHLPHSLHHCLRKILRSPNFCFSSLPMQRSG